MNVIQSAGSSRIGLPIGDATYCAAFFWAQLKIRSEFPESGYNLFLAVDVMSPWAILVTALPAWRFGGAALSLLINVLFKFLGFI